LLKQNTEHKTVNPNKHGLAVVMIPEKKFGK